MIRHPVTSSRIANIGYNPSTTELEVTFREGSIYRYRGVPERLFYTFLTVVSKGRFYDGVIYNKFPEKRIR
ncbi:MULTISPECIES: KTSC domain-containing protein [Tenebrionibacter/Tenebrionicola group]|jgi:hypothetical protein|uniref:KTSC domain-containing protein n=2 Tax=Tenebrionibacter/Tenebrionicola group TaxID=2969848 RepID=A0A8K0V5Q8_9ENTR|nr:MULTISPECIES: KTSC domain-containing protein [Tenebrionibacter/Tenebrionicola group]MBK4716256.1 KTSC domain-containing protein [Tenebrionibacter intestinalis]MBV4411270.1 KTSC domain-containing protein [Tenebrionicola larvae]MBV5096911.1 KTSC domain-containing protein [Tenebrionicola larvae]